MNVIEYLKISSIINQILHSYINIFVLIYLNKILIHSNLAQNCQKHLSLILRKLKLYMSTINQSEIEFYKYINDNKIIKILD